MLIAIWILVFLVGMLTVAVVSLNIRISAYDVLNAERRIRLRDSIETLQSKERGAHKRYEDLYADCQETRQRVDALLDHLHLQPFVIPSSEPRMVLTTKRL